MLDPFSFAKGQQAIAIYRKYKPVRITQKDMELRNYPKT